MNTKKEKISQYKAYIESAQKALQRAKYLYSALQTWDKKIINKNFFEYHFTCKDENGEGRKDWKGKIVTDFYFSDKAYEWEKYAKRLFLSPYEYVELQDTSTIEVCRAVKEKIALLNERIVGHEKNIAELERIDEKSLIKDLIEVYHKHGKPSIWGDVLSSYEVKYPSEK